MGILRTDVVSHSQLETTGSLELDGVGDYLTFGAHDSFSPVESDVTFELWFYLTADASFIADSGNYYFFDMGSNGYRIQMYEGLIRFGIDGSSWTPPATGVSKTKWHHVAGVREGNSLDLYLDGKHVGQKTINQSVTSTSLTIGNYGGAPYDGEPYGYISNFRYVKGVVYRGEFTPPKFELKNIPGTIVLGCQSTTSATDFAVTPSAITAQGNATASAFHPGLKKDISDTGVVFDGVTTFDSQAFMVPPSGKTTERNRGRAVVGGGYDNPNVRSEMDYFNIQSMGNAIDFGNLTTTTFGLKSNAASSTRGIIAVGGRTPTYVNTIEFITIATTSNATDFGDTGATGANIATSSNQTRGILMGGRNPTRNTIEFITIATTGNASDFGDLTAAKRQGPSVASPTRAIYAGGFDDTNRINNIEFVTIASAGNASDFGDLTDARQEAGGASDNTRGVFAGGYDAPARVNIIDFITMASAGNAVDFGDTLTALTSSIGSSNNTRGVFPGYNDGGRQNTIYFVTIQTTGNAQDFGDLTVNRTGASCCSDSHGGLS